MPSCVGHALHFRFPLLVSGVVFSLLLRVFVPGPAQAADPTADQQYWLELINRMRLNPAAVLDRLVHFSAPGVWAPTKSDDPWVQAALDYYGTDAAALQGQWSALSPAPALAWNSLLSNSATSYSDLMVQMQQQSHSLDGKTLAQRITDGGYTSQFLELGESLFASTQNVLHGHSAFAIDWGDDDGNSANGFGTGIQTPPLHREVLMDRLFKEIGIGFQNGTVPPSNGGAPGPLVVTQHYASQYRWTGSRYVSDAIVTGVIHLDSVVADQFYTPGEGIASAMIELWDTFTATLVTSGLSNAAGGFNLVAQNLVQGRQYAVRASGYEAPDVIFTAAATVYDYGAPVTIFDNAYARFTLVPEPGASFLCLSAGLYFMTSRRRRSIP